MTTEIVKDALFVDNNGGDILEIIYQGDGKYMFQVGHSCVFCLRKFGTISEITKWLTEITFKLPEDVETVERRF